MKTPPITNDLMPRWLLLLAIALFPAAASAGLLESYETSVPQIPKIPIEGTDPVEYQPTPYLAIEQSSSAGVTQGTKSMKVVYDFSAKWMWFTTNYGAPAYADWHANDILLIDVHRPVLSGNSKLHLRLAVNGPMGWKEYELVAWAWMNAGDTTTQTVAVDYRALRDASPAPAEGDWFQLNLLARSDMEVTPAGSGLGGEVYIDNVRFVPFVTPPPSAFYTFDSGAEGFQHYNGASPDATYSTNFGGSMKLAAKLEGSGSDFAWHLGKEINTGYQLERLQSLVTNGGTISYDVIGPAGSLAGHGFTSAIKVYNTWEFIQVNRIIQAMDVTALDDGNEIARVTMDAANFGELLTLNTGYGFYLGYNGTDEYHFDNLLFAPKPDSGAAVTFDFTKQNVTALPNSTAVWENDGVAIANPPSYEGGASAVFTNNSSDPQVAAVYAQLVAAAEKGGTLRYKIQHVAVNQPTENFFGFQVTTALVGDMQDHIDYIPSSDLTEGGDPGAVPPVPPNATPASYSRIVEIDLAPADSLFTDGFRLPAAAASYAFHIRSDYSELDAAGVKLRIDDFEVVANADPKILYTPPLAGGSGSYVGRVLTTVRQNGIYSATGLPLGLVMDSGTGLIHGTPITNGTFHVVFTIEGPGGSDTTEEMDWEITGVGTDTAPMITSFTYSAGAATVSWSGAATATVHRSTTMAADSWEKISENNMVGTFTDENPPVGKAFYRVSVP